MTYFTEETLAVLIAALPPAPHGWVLSAIELPRAREAIDELAARASADRVVREAILADMDEALRGVGVEPSHQLLERLTVRLSRLNE